MRRSIGAVGINNQILQISLYRYVFHCYILRRAFKFSIPFQGHSQDFLKGPGNTVSIGGFSPDFDVLFTTCGSGGCLLKTYKEGDLP